jgi:hypothetical protein
MGSRCKLVLPCAPQLLQLHVSLAAVLERPLQRQLLQQQQQQKLTAMCHRHRHLLHPQMQQ